MLAGRTPNCVRMLGTHDTIADRFPTEFEKLGGRIQRSLWYSHAFTSTFSSRFMIDVGRCPTLRDSGGNEGSDSLHQGRFDLSLCCSR